MRRHRNSDFTLHKLIYFTPKVEDASGSGNLGIVGKKLIEHVCDIVEEDQRVTIRTIATTELGESDDLFNFIETKIMLTAFIRSNIFRQCIWGPFTNVAVPPSFDYLEQWSTPLLKANCPWF